MYDTVIIGAGIAGCTAAIYAARNKMNFLLITKEFGGQFMESGEILNYPGITKTTGAQFAMQMDKQLGFNNVTVKEGEEVKKIEKKGKGFVVISGKAKYETKTIIVATGARARKLRIPGEDDFAKKGVYYCAICDGPLLAGKDVAIIGGGNSALAAADFMKSIAKKIYVINNKGRFKAHKYLVDNLKEMKNAEVISSATTIRILGDKSVKGLTYDQEAKTKELKVQGIIVEIGREANTEFVKGLLKLDEHKHIKIDCQTNTSVPGIFAAGDCTSVHEYQYVIAAGQGCVALIKARRHLSGG